VWQRTTSEHGQPPAHHRPATNRQRDWIPSSSHRNGPLMRAVGLINVPPIEYSHQSPSGESDDRAQHCDRLPIQTGWLMDFQSFLSMSPSCQAGSHECGAGTRTPVGVADGGELPGPGASQCHS